MNPRPTSRMIRAAVVTLTMAPFGVLLVQSFADRWTGRRIVPQSLGGRAWRALSDDPILARAVTNSLTIAVIAVSIALIVGYGAAAGLARTRSRTRIAVLAGLLAPLLVPELAVGAGLTTWILRLGLADSIPGVVAAHLLYVVPYVVIALLPGFDADLRAHEEAADAFGASRVLRLRTVTLPALAPSLALAAALGFTVSWSQYGTSLAVGGGMPLLPLVAVPFLRADPQIGAALTLVLLLPAATLVAGSSLATRTER